MVRYGLKICGSSFSTETHFIGLSVDLFCEQKTPCLSSYLSIYRNFAKGLKALDGLFGGGAEVLVRSLVSGNDPAAAEIAGADQESLFERSGLVFVFNFDPQTTHADYVIPVSVGRDHEVLFTTDDEAYGGFGNISHAPCSAYVQGHDGPALSLCLPPRTAMVLQPVAE